MPDCLRQKGLHAMPKIVSLEPDYSWVGTRTLRDQLPAIEESRI